MFKSSWKQEWRTQGIRLQGTLTIVLPWAGFGYLNHYDGRSTYRFWFHFSELITAAGNTLTKCHNGGKSMFEEFPQEGQVVWFTPVHTDKTWHKAVSITPPAGADLIIVERQLEPCHEEADHALYKPVDLTNKQQPPAYNNLFNSFVITDPTGGDPVSPVLEGIRSRPPKRRLCSVVVSAFQLRKPKSRRVVNTLVKFGDLRDALNDCDLDDTGREPSEESSHSSRSL